MAHFNGGLIGVGGGSGGGGSVGSGVSNIGGQAGPFVAITGVNGVTYTGTGNQLIVDGAALSGLIPLTSGIESINQENGPHINIFGSGTVEVFTFGSNIIVSGQTGVPSISGVNGITTFETSSGDVLIDGSLISGINTINGISVPNLLISGVNVDIIQTGLDSITIVASSGVSAVSGINRLIEDNGQQIISGILPEGVNGIVVSELGDEIIIDGAALSGVNKINDINESCITLSGINGVTVTSGASGVIFIESNLPSGVCFTENFVAITSGNFQHNFNSEDIIVQVRSNIGEVIIPDRIIQQDSNSVDLTFTTATTGKVNVLGCGSGFFIQSSVDCFTQAINIPGLTSQTFTHNLGSTGVVVSLQDSAGLMVEADSVTINDANSVTVAVTAGLIGIITILACGGSTPVGITSVNGQSGPALTVLGGSGISIDNTGTNQITINASGLRKTAATFANSLTWTLVHNFGTSDVIVQTYDNVMRQIIPDTTDSSNPNQVIVSHNVMQAGRMIIIG